MIDKLKQGKKVILTGEFSSTMLDELTPLFEQNIDNIQNLILLIEGEEIPPQLSFLPSDAYQIIPRKQSPPTQEQKDTNQGWREEVPDYQDCDLSNSTQKTTLTHWHQKMCEVSALISGQFQLSTLYAAQP